MGKKRRLLIKKAFGEPSGYAYIDLEEVLGKQESLDKLKTAIEKGTITYNRGSPLATKFREAIGLDDDTFANLSDAALTRYHLAYQQMLINNPLAKDDPKRMARLDADFANEMKEHIYQQAKTELQTLLSSDKLDSKVKARAQQILDLTKSYEGYVHGHYLERDDLIKGLLGTIKYVEGNDPNNEEKLNGTLRIEIEQRIDYATEKALASQARMHPSAASTLRSITRAVTTWAGLPGFKMDMKERIETLKAVNAIMNRDWETFDELKLPQVFEERLKKAKYREQVQILKEDLDGSLGQLAIVKKDFDSEPTYEQIKSEAQGRSGYLLDRGQLYYIDARQNKVNKVTKPEEGEALVHYENIIKHLDGDKTPQGEAALRAGLKSLGLIQETPLEVRQEFKSLMRAVDRRGMPIDVRIMVISQMQAGLQALREGKKFEINLDAPYQERIKNYVDRINYAWQLNELDGVIKKKLEVGNFREVTALKGLRNSVQGMLAYATVSREDRIKALEVAQRMANGNLTDDDKVWLDKEDNPFKARFDAIKYGQALDEIYAIYKNNKTKPLSFIDILRAKPGELDPVEVAVANMRIAIENRYTFRLSLLTVPQLTAGLKVLKLAIDNPDKRVIELEGYKDLPPFLQRKVGRVEYERDKLTYTNLQKNEHIPAEVKDIIKLLATRADNVYATFRLPITQRSLGYLAATELLKVVEDRVKEGLGKVPPVEYDSDVFLADLVAKAQELAKDEKYSRYVADLEQIPVNYALNELKKALVNDYVYESLYDGKPRSINKIDLLTPEQSMLIMQLQTLANDPRLPLETRINALKAARHYVLNPTPNNAKNLEISARAIPEYFLHGEGKSITNIAWTNQVMGGFIKLIDKVTQVSPEYEKAYVQAVEALHDMSSDNSQSAEVRAAIIALKAKIDSVANASWSSITLKQRIAGLELAKLLAQGLRVKDPSIINPANSAVLDDVKTLFSNLPAVLQRKVLRVEYERDKAAYIKLAETLPKEPLDIKGALANIITRAEYFLPLFRRLSIDDRRLGYVIASDLANAFQTNGLDGLMDKAQELMTTKGVYTAKGAYNTVIDKVVISMVLKEYNLSDAVSYMNDQRPDGHEISDDFRKLIKLLEEKAQDPSIPLEIRLEALKAAKAFIADPLNPDLKSQFIEKAKAIPNYVLEGAGYSMFNVFKNRQMTSLMSRLTSTTGKSDPFKAKDPPLKAFGRSDSKKDASPEHDSSAPTQRVR